MSVDLNEMVRTINRAHKSVRMPEGFNQADNDVNATLGFAYVCWMCAEKHKPGEPKETHKCLSQVKDDTALINPANTANLDDMYKVYNVNANCSMEMLVEKMAEFDPLFAGSLALVYEIHPEKRKAWLAKAEELDPAIRQELIEMK